METGSIPVRGADTLEAMTVSELIAELQKFNGDLLVTRELDEYSVVPVDSVALGRYHVDTTAPSYVSESGELQTYENAAFNNDPPPTGGVEAVGIS